MLVLHYYIPILANSDSLPFSEYLNSGQIFGMNSQSDNCSTHSSPVMKPKSNMDTDCILLVSYIVR